MAESNPAFAETAEPKKLDDMWQRQQKKTFTAWVNSHLRKRSLAVEEVSQDLSDGKNLLQLLEIISDEQLPKPARGKMRIHSIENVGKAIQFINDKGVDVKSIGPEEVVDHNLKMILGLLWMLILRFEIQDISEEHMNAKDALLLWCQRKTEPYDNVDIQNFHMSWKDGLGFCALIHRHRPELIDYASLSKNNPRQNFELAFSVADKHLDIPPMLDVEDMLECIKPDERSVMTYVAAYYKAFANSNTVEIAAKKIATVLNTNREHERLMEEYQTMATNLLAWINQKIAELNERNDLREIADCQAVMDAINKLRSEEVPIKLTERSALEEHYRTLQTKLRLSGRPPYVASEGQEISDIAAAWANLEAADLARFDWVVGELKRIKLAESKAKMFFSKSAAHEAWTDGLEANLSADDYSNANLAGIQALEKKHEAFNSDLSAHENRVHEIGTLANELDELKYAQIDSVHDKYASIYENWQELVKLTDARKNNIAAAMERQQQLDQLYLDFAKQAPALSNVLESAKDKLTEPYVVETPEDVAAIQANHEAFKQSLPEYENAYNTISTIHAGIEALGGQSSPYSNHTYDSLSSKWNEMQALISSRDDELANEAAI
jgi:actinin alpha